MKLKTLSKEGRLPDLPRHMTHPALLRNVVHVALVGCGGTGSQLLSNLGRLDMTLQALGGHRRLSVTVWDSGLVREPNGSRQLFGRGDEGQHKAVCLVDRVNRFYGVDWTARTERFTPGYGVSCDILVSCVDTAKSRAEIHRSLSRYANIQYWLDCGNGRQHGQVILGQPKTQDREEGWALSSEIPPPEKMRWGRAFYASGDKYPPLRLPCVTEYHPELLSEDYEEDDTPSCSLVDSTNKQSLAVNQAAANWAFTILCDLFLEGGVDSAGVFFDLPSRQANPIPFRIWPIRPVRYDAKGLPVLPKGNFL